LAGHHFDGCLGIAADNAIELHATMAEWSADGRHLTVYDATQYVAGTRHMLAKKFGPDLGNVRVIAAFVGGGFGARAPRGRTSRWRPRRRSSSAAR
jgi:xanthine dehydrogenase molybdopterin-binding subunit B